MTARLVEGVTKISRLDLLAPEARQAENLRKMLLAMVNDVRVVVMKLADRLHNMRTLEFLPPEKQQRIARETLDIYAPIAHRLGMGLIRGELEDLAFQLSGTPTLFWSCRKPSAARSKRMREISERSAGRDSRKAGGKRGSRRSGRPREAALFHSPENSAAAAHARSDLRSARRANHHRLHAQLLCARWA